VSNKLIWPIFWAIVGVFVVAACIFAIPPARELLMGLPFMIIAGAVLFLLGIALIVLTLKQKLEGISKKFMLLTGASVVGIPVAILLHNAVYGLFIYWFGADFWKGGDEPVFFILAVIVCPIGFLVGVVGNIVLAVKKNRRQSIT